MPRPMSIYKSGITKPKPNHPQGIYTARLRNGREVLAKPWFSEHYHAWDVSAVQYANNTQVETAAMKLRAQGIKCRATTIGRAKYVIIEEESGNDQE